MGRKSLAIFLVCLCTAVAEICAGQGSLPSTVTARLKKIDTHMTAVESALQAGEVDRNNLKWAQLVFDEIAQQYPQHLKAPEVVAAKERIERAKQAIEKIEADKKDEKEKEEQGAKNAEALAEEWAQKLSAYKPDPTPGSKGDYGTPIGKVEDILTRRAHYLEAKALYGEFKKTGIDKDSHWKLRSAEYDIRVGIQNYEQSLERLVAETEDKVKQWAEWIAGQKTSKTPLAIGTLELLGLRKRMEGYRKLVPESDPRRTATEAAMAQLERDQASVEAVVLKSRKMKPDAYKGSDAAAIKSLAKSLVERELGKEEYVGQKGQVLRIHIISANWNRESAVEWTDTTESALQYRVTLGMNVQVAAKWGSMCFLFTLFVHKDTIDGSQGGLKGHVMFRDKFLESNLPK